MSLFYFILGISWFTKKEYEFFFTFAYDYGLFRTPRDRASCLDYGMIELSKIPFSRLNALDCTT